MRGHRPDCRCFACTRTGRSTPSYGYRHKRDTALVILLTVLREREHVTAREIIDAGRQHHISRTTLRRAADELGLRVGGGYWEMP
jgi:hypothetical protein